MKSGTLLAYCYRKQLHINWKRRTYKKENVPQDMFAQVRACWQYGKVLLEPALRHTRLKPLSRPKDISVSHGQVGFCYAWQAKHRQPSKGVRRMLINAEHMRSRQTRAVTDEHKIVVQDVMVQSKVWTNRLGCEVCNIHVSKASILIFSPSPGNVRKGSWYKASPSPELQTQG